MKKIFIAILVFIIVVIMACPIISVSADELETDVTVEIAEDITETPEEPASHEPSESTTIDEDITYESLTDEVINEAEEGVLDSEDDEEYIENDLFSRIWEFVNEYRAECISGAGSFILLVVNLIIKVSNSKTAKKTEAMFAGQNLIIDSVNGMIQGYNGMKDSYDKYGMTEDERNRVVGAVLATNTAILEILTTVYANSKNLPQGVKDIVNIKYANCLKSIQDDKQRIALVEAVRSNISAAPASDEEAVENEDTSSQEV